LIVIKFSSKFESFSEIQNLVKNENLCHIFVVNNHNFVERSKFLGTYLIFSQKFKKYCLQNNQLFIFRVARSENYFRDFLQNNRTNEIRKKRYVVRIGPFIYHLALTFQKIDKCFSLLTNRGA